MKTISSEDLSQYCVGKENHRPADYKLRLFIPIGIDSNGKDFAYGPGLHRLMHEIKNCGTIVKASQNMGMAYSKCWKILRSAEACLGFKFLERHMGRGNGSTLTPQAEEYLARYDAFLEEVTKAANESFQKHFSDLPFYPDQQPESAPKLQEDDEPDAP